MQNSISVRKSLLPLLAAMIVCVFASAPCVHAQGIVFRASIPFAFTIGETSLPAGEYVITDTRTHLKMANQTTHKTILASVLFEDEVNPASAGLAHFSRVGKEYFLDRIAVEGESRWYRTFSSKRRKELMRAQQQIQPAAQEMAVAAVVPVSR